MPSKKIRLRLYADENFPVPSATYLKSKGISIVHAYDINLINKDDRLHIQRAKKLQRTLVTVDRDFLYYSDLTVKGSLGVVVISTGNATPLHINQILNKTLSKISPEYAKEAFIKVTIDKIIRIKKDKKDEKFI